MHVEFQVCQVQTGRVTFVNNEWVGRVAPSVANQDAAYDSCPREADYLNAAGESGWILVSVLPRFAVENDVHFLYLQRIRG